MPRRLAGAALAVFLALAGEVLAEPGAARQDELVNLLRHDCGSCHGLTLKGGLGPALLPANLDGKPDEALVQVILDGLPGTPMPPWRGLLAEDEAHWMVEFMKDGAAP
jgi:cytochrome c55X